MRTVGAVAAARGLGLHDHVCWPYENPVDFRARAVEFLADGLALGQRCWYVAEGSPEALAADVAVFGAELASGALRVVPADSTYEVVTRPADQVAVYAAATEAALADGCTGLRVAAEATPLVRGAAALDAFCRYEHLVDRYMAGRPFAALCAYDRAELPESAIGQLACLHPASGVGASPFRLFAVPDARLALEGQLDLVSRADFPRALDRAGVRPGGGPVVVDASALEFIDHHALLALSRAGGEVVLRTSRPGPARLVSVLDVPGVRVEAL